VDRAQAIKARPFLLAWCICFVLMEAFGTIFAGGGAHTDFRAFYSAGHIVMRHPSQLYDLTQQRQTEHALVSEEGFLSFYHPGYEALLFAPFSLLNYHSAYLAFIAFNLLLVMAAFFAARPEFSSVIPWLQPRPGLIFFAYLPLLIAISLGQDSILFLLLLCLTWRQLESGREIGAGCILALALFKFQIVLPIAALMAVRCGWRFSVGFLMSAAGVVLLSVGVAGFSGTASWVQLLFGAASIISKGAVEQKIRVFPLALTNITGLIYACGGRYLSSPFTFNLLVGICSLSLFVWCMRVIQQCELSVAFSIAILCGLLVSYHLNIYDLTLALLPVVLLVDQTSRYILLALFILPVIVLQFGLNWHFLLAIPVLALLVSTLTSPARRAASVTETAATAAI